MVDVGVEIAGALDCGVDQAGAIAAESLEEGARGAAILGARSLITGVECPESAVRSEVWAMPDSHWPGDVPGCASFLSRSRDRAERIAGLSDAHKSTSQPAIGATPHSSLHFLALLTTSF